MRRPRNGSSINNNRISRSRYERGFARIRKQAVVFLPIVATTAYASAASAATANTVLLASATVGTNNIHSVTTKKEPSTPDWNSNHSRHRKHQNLEDEERLAQYQEQRLERMKQMKQEMEKTQQQTQRHSTRFPESSEQNSDTHSASSKRNLQSGCKLCYSGIPTPNPFIELSSVDGWTCGELGVFMESLGPEELECLQFQAVGYGDCECPTSPLEEDYCALCSYGNGLAEIIPDQFMDLPIPSTDTQPVQGLTCADLVFVRQNNPPIPCDRLWQYQQYCGCPVPNLQRQNDGTETADEGEDEGESETSDAEETGTDENTETPTMSGPGSDFVCQLCPNQEPPAFGDRTLPYLISAPQPQSNTLPFNPQNPNRITTCGVLAEQAASGAMDDVARCYDYVFPPIPVDVPAYCGCSGTQRFDLCSLCPDGVPLVNPDLTVPGTGGMSCLGLADYLSFVTDANSCNIIADSASELCCTPLPECPVCVNPLFRFNREKLYPPFGLTCDQLNLALSPALNIDISCEEIQNRFGFYCECDNAIQPSCSLCADNEGPPDPSQLIPALGPGITCGEVSDYASLRPFETCTVEITSWSVDVRAFCGCPGFEARGICSAQCPGGLLVNTYATVPDVAGISSDGTVTCGELADFAPFVNGPSLCAAIQNTVAVLCCVPEDRLVSPVSPKGDEEDEFGQDGNTTAPDPGTDGRLFNKDGSFIVYPFSHNNKALDAVTPEEDEDVYQRDPIASPYMGSFRHPRSSALVRWNHSVPFLATFFVASILGALQ